MEGIIVLVAFSFAFVGITIWTYLPRNKKTLHTHGNIPFREDENGR